MNISNTSSFDMDEVTTLMKDLIPFVFSQNDNIEVSKKQILCELSKMKSEVDKQEQKDHQKAAMERYTKAYYEMNDMLKERERSLKDAQESYNLHFDQLKPTAAKVASYANKLKDEQSKVTEDYQQKIKEWTSEMEAKIAQVNEDYAIPIELSDELERATTAVKSFEISGKYF